MSRTQRLITVLAALLLAGSLALPLWEVRLVAPQYPEGLGMRIHANTVAGIKPNDLQSINGLNHYIGMKPIEPDAIPELRWMPWIVVGLTVFGLIAAGVGSRAMLMGWLAAFALLCAAGLWDFHHWEYDYGHNLDMANAIIVVPGMNYEPPLIGSKQLLNFRATSWPAPGAYLLGGAFALGLGALFVKRERKRTSARAQQPATLLAHGVG